MEDRLSGAGKAELGRVRLADDDKPGPQKSLGHRAVIISHEPIEEAAAKAGCCASIMGQVLKKEWNPPEGSLRALGSDGLFGPVIQPVHDRVEIWVLRFDPLNRRGQELLRTDCPFGDEAG
jgi:hypothetical protein